MQSTGPLLELPKNSLLPHNSAIRTNPTMEFQAAPLVFFRPATCSDLDRIVQLEDECFPPDEVESREVMEGRVLQAPGLFMVAVQSSAEGTGDDDVIGFMCGTLTSGTRLSKACMERHEPEGDSACVHSVCIANSARGQGLASRMVRAYLAFVQQTTPQLRAVRLLTKEYLLRWYVSLGFQVVGPSLFPYGRDSWTEMVLSLPTAAGTSTAWAASSTPASGGSSLVEAGSRTPAALKEVSVKGRQREDAALESWPGEEAEPKQ